MQNFIEKAPQISMNNRLDVKKSNNCGCYYCCSIFTAKDVVFFVDKEESATCPKCGVDAVIPDIVVPELHFELLEQMKKRWF